MDLEKKSQGDFQVFPPSTGPNGEELFHHGVPTDYKRGVAGRTRIDSALGRKKGRIALLGEASIEADS